MPIKVQVSNDLTDNLAQFLTRHLRAIRILNHARSLHPEELRSLERVQCTGIFSAAFAVRLLAPEFSLSEGKLEERVRSRLQVVIRHAQIPRLVAETLRVVVDRLALLRPIVVERGWEEQRRLERELTAEEIERNWECYSLLRRILNDLVAVLPRLTLPHGVVAKPVDGDLVYEYLVQAIKEYRVLEKASRSKKYPEELKRVLRSILNLRTLQALRPYVEGRDTPSSEKAAVWFESNFPVRNGEFFRSLHSRLSLQLTELKKLNQLIAKCEDREVRRRLGKGANVIRLHVDFLLSSVILLLPEQ